MFAEAMMGDMEQGDGRRVRGGGGGARRAERTAVSFETARFIERNIPNFEILNEEPVAFDNQTWNRRYRGFMDKIKTGSPFGAQAGIHRPEDLHPARPQPGAECRDRRPQSGAGAGLRPALRARCRWWAALCHDP